MEEYTVALTPQAEQQLRGCIFYFFRLFVLVTALVVVLVTAVVGLTAGERFGFRVRAVVAAGSPRASTSLSSF